MGVENSDPKSTLGSRVMPDKQGIDRLNRYDPVRSEISLGDTLEGIATQVLTFVIPDPGDGVTAKIGFECPFPFRVLEASCYPNKAPATSMVVDILDDASSILTGTVTLDTNNTLVLASIDASLADIADGSLFEISAAQTGAIAAGGCNTTIALTIVRL